MGIIVVLQTSCLQMIPHILYIHNLLHLNILFMWFLQLLLSLKVFFDIHTTFMAFHKYAFSFPQMSFLIKLFTLWAIETVFSVRIRIRELKLTSE